MAEGLEADDELRWRHTFAIIAQIGNTTKSKKSDAIDPLQFYPYKDKKNGEEKERRVTSGMALTRENVVDVLGAFFGKKNSDA